MGKEFDSQFSGKYALVTGGTQGLGFAVASLFAQRGCAGLIVCGRRTEAGTKAAAQIAAGNDCQVKFVTADVSSVAACRELVAAVDEQFGRVDILVNAAGSTDRGTILDTSEELFDRTFATNVKGPFFLMQQCAKLMRREESGGAIVNIGSIAAIAGQPFIAAYCAAKGALGILTKNTAFALMSDHIRVNCLNIGWMNTEGEDATQRKYHGATDGWLEAASAKMPFGRLLEPTEVARAVAFLASAESGMMTGEALIFDQVIPGAFMEQPLPERLAD